MILCDIGNTTFHFKTKNREFKVYITKGLNNLSQYEKKKIFFISVNNKATQQFIKKYPHAINIQDITQFKTAYKGMGIDRQVVSKYYKNAIIIDAGSAITVDIMVKKKHKGGFILPGITALQKIYPKISKKLSFQFENDINLDKMPLNTNDAINYALLQSIILPIEEVSKKYKVPLFFTGGDGKILMEILLKKGINSTMKYKNNLIFQSMRKIISQNTKGK